MLWFMSPSNSEIKARRYVVAQMDQLDNSVYVVASLSIYFVYKK